MIDLGPGVGIPQGLQPFIAGLALWLGISWLTTPTLMERAVDIHAAPQCDISDNPELCPCILKSIKHDAFNNTVLVSTLGLSDTRVRLFENPNPLVQYALLEVEHPVRRNECALQAQSPDSMIALREAEAAFDIKQKETAARNKLAHEEMMAEVGRKVAEQDELIVSAIDSPIGEHAADKLKQAKRMYDLSDDSTNILLDFWETANNYGRRKIHEWNYN